MIAHQQIVNDFHTYRREFKISGQIGLPDQKDKLSFSSLIYQIENGTRPGYKENDIVDAVVKSITPGVPMRSYLEGRSALTLASLRHVLRSHYCVKPPRDLYKILNNTAQEPKETAQEYVIRILDMRQKILFASQEAGSGYEIQP